jgi:secondary thiamine-phosphate synthase enzyme
LVIIRPRAPSPRQMKWQKETFIIPTRGKGLYPFTDLVSRRIREWGIEEGMCYLFIQHTSASLLISESYDPSAKIDLETYLEKIAPESQPWYRHTLEGPDDSSSHIRAMLTPVSLTIPIDQGGLSLGTWQGIYLFEHRVQSQRRHVLLRCLDVTG